MCVCVHADGVGVDKVGKKDKHRRQTIRDLSLSLPFQFLYYFSTYTIHNSQRFTYPVRILDPKSIFLKNELSKKYKNTHNLLVNFLNVRHCELHSNKNSKTTTFFSSVSNFLLSKMKK